MTTVVTPPDSPLSTRHRHREIAVSLSAHQIYCDLKMSIFQQYQSQSANLFYPQISEDYYYDDYYYYSRGQEIPPPITYAELKREVLEESSIHGNSSGGESGSGGGSIYDNNNGGGGGADPVGVVQEDVQQLRYFFFK